MGHRFDVLVVGAGVIGSSLAYHLARKGARVAVLERDTVGGQATRAAAGMLAAQEETDPRDPLGMACLASRNQFEQSVLEVRYLSGFDPEYEVNGICRLARTEHEKRDLLKKKAAQEAAGLPVEWWTPETVRDSFPALETDMAGGLFFPKDGQINGRKWTAALVEASRYLGVRFVERVESLSLQRDGRRVTGLRAGMENYESDQVVFAAGAWTSSLLSDLGVRILFEPVKGQLLSLESFPRAWRCPLFIESGYFTPQADGNVLVGATVEHVGFDSRPTLAARHDLAEWAVRYCPALKLAAVSEHRAGLRPGTADGWPVMGPVPGWEGLFVCAGHYRNGILLSPCSGRYMADGLLENRWDPLGDSFRPDRIFKKARPVA
jgi:glycine oxidase